MKQLPILKTLVQVLFVFSLLAMFFAVPFLLITIVMPDSVPFTIYEQKAVELPLISKLIAFIIVGAVALYIYALYIFKQTLVLFEKKRVFDPAVIKNFQLIGRNIFGGYLLYAIGSMAFKLSLNTLEINTDFIVDSIITIAIGLFFFVLSEVFQMAKTLKEENDLTV